MINYITEKNIGLVRSLFYKSKQSCTSLASEIGVSVPSVQKMLNVLIDAKIIEESGIGDSNGGRRPATYSLVPDTAYILSVAMDQFTTRVVLIDMQLNVVDEIKEFDLNLYETDTAEALIQIVKEALETWPQSRNKIIGAGVAMPGFVNETEGINYSYLKPPNNLSLREYLSEMLDMPVLILNDSNAVALAELKMGLGLGSKEMMVINVGWGIGLGIIVHGQMYHGYSGFAGEFSHIPLIKDGNLCNCGKHGCLETVASLINVEQKAKNAVADEHTATSLKHVAEEINIYTVFNEAKKGDFFSVKLISEAAYNIGQGLAILLHLMNPELIVLSGKGAMAGKLWLAPVQQAVNEHCIPRLASSTEILMSEIGSNAELFGAAAFVMQNLNKIIAANSNELIN